MCCLPAVLATRAATAAVAAAIGLGTRFVDVESAAVEISAVQAVDRGCAFGIHAHLHESESTRAARITIRDDVYAIHSAVRFEHGTDRIFGRAEGEITHENVCQFSFLSEF